MVAADPERERIAAGERWEPHGVRGSAGTVGRA